MAFEWKTTRKLQGLRLDKFDYFKLKKENGGMWGEQKEPLMTICFSATAKKSTWQSMKLSKVKHNLNKILL